MAKTISIKLAGIEYDVALVKVERSKIYGWSQVQAINAEGNVCTQGGINNDGTTLVDAGCTKIGLMTADGRWMDRSELQAYKKDGSPAQLMPSTFDEGINLTSKAAVEDLLDLNVQAVYQLTGDGIAELSDRIGEDIYQITFSYRGGYDVSDAFIIAGDEALFIICGSSSTYEPIGIFQEGVLDNDADGLFEDDDELDFNMM